MTCNEKGGKPKTFDLFVDADNICIQGRKFLVPFHNRSSSGFESITLSSSQKNLIKSCIGLLPKILIETFRAKFEAEPGILIAVGDWANLKNNDSLSVDMKLEFERHGFETSFPKLWSSRKRRDKNGKVLPAYKQAVDLELVLKVLSNTISINSNPSSFACLASGDNFVASLASSIIDDRKSELYPEAIHVAGFNGSISPQIETLASRSEYINLLNLNEYDEFIQARTQLHSELGITPNEFTLWNSICHSAVYHIQVAEKRGTYEFLDRKLIKNWMRGWITHYQKFHGVAYVSTDEAFDKLLSEQIISLEKKMTRSGEKLSCLICREHQFVIDAITSINRNADYHVFMNNVAPLVKV